MNYISRRLLASLVLASAMHFPYHSVSAQEDPEAGARPRLQLRDWPLLVEATMREERDAKLSAEHSGTFENPQDRRAPALTLSGAAMILAGITNAAALGPACTDGVNVTAVTTGGLVAAAGAIMTTVGAYRLGRSAARGTPRRWGRAAGWSVLSFFAAQTLILPLSMAEFFGCIST